MKPIQLGSNEILALAGLAVLALGIALVSIPAAFIVTGALVLAYAIIPDQSPGGPTQ